MSTSGLRMADFPIPFCRPFEVLQAIRRILSVICLNTEQDMDGKDIAFGLATAPGPDWLKDVIPALGLRLKVHNSLRTWCAECQVSIYV